MYKGGLELTGFRVSETMPEKGEHDQEDPNRKERHRNLKLNQSPKWAP